MSDTIVVTGADGMLGRAVMSHGQKALMDMVGFTRAELDITIPAQVEQMLGRYENATVINCAGIVKGRKLPLARFLAVNTYAPLLLAIHAHRLIHVSTDCVFSGNIIDGGYTESSKPDATDDYGISKLRGEVTFAPHLTVRGSFIGLGDRGLLNWFFSQPQNAVVQGFGNVIWNGVTAKAFAKFLLVLAKWPDLTGLIHYPGPLELSKYTLLRQIGVLMRPDIQIEAVYPEAKRMVLASEKGWSDPTLWSTMMQELQDDYSNDPRWA